MEQGDFLVKVKVDMYNQSTVADNTMAKIHCLPKERCGSQPGKNQPSTELPSPLPEPSLRSLLWGPA